MRLFPERFSWEEKTHHECCWHCPMHWVPRWNEKEERAPYHIHLWMLPASQLWTQHDKVSQAPAPTSPL